MSSGLSDIGMCPQPGSRIWRASGRSRLARSAVTLGMMRSCEPQTSVTGTAAGGQPHRQEPAERVACDVRPRVGAPMYDHDNSVQMTTTLASI